MTRAEWEASARRSADAALDIYTERDADVERELALHLSRALRELEKDGTERQQAIDERDKDYEVACDLVKEIHALEARCEQAIDALRELASLTSQPPTSGSLGVRELSKAHNAARAALLSLGEQP